MTDRLRIAVRAEKPGDEAAIAGVESAAFPTVAEAGLVDALRRAGNLEISLVALLDDEIVGHIAFSPVSLDVPSGQRIGLGLAPIAVHPHLQKQGIGTALVHAGLRECGARGAAFVVVLGEPAYYRRFGFAPASKWGIANEYQARDEFMAIELLAGGIPDSCGLARYSPQFGLVA